MPVMIYIWLSIFISALVIEAGAPGLVSIWFAAGSFVSLILAAFLGNSLIWLQVLVFLGVSVGALFVIRPLLKKSRSKDKPSNIDTLIGKIGFVIDKIVPYEVGSVKVGGLVWSAILFDNKQEEIAQGKKVTIERIEGNKLVVKEYKEETK